MTENGFRKIALGLDGAVEGSHMGHPDFRGGGRIFATLHGDGRTGMIKLTPEQQAQFVGADPEVFAPENGAWGRQGCTRVQLRHGASEIVGEAMTLAWQNAMAAPAPRTRQRKRR
jgi:hypothetical protein